MITAHTRLFTIFGDPVAHIRAPAAWGKLFERHGIDAAFLCAHVSPAELNAAVTGFKTLQNVGGLMFTMPHKHAAVHHADVLTPRARQVGSINLLARSLAGTWVGDNIDGAGFISGLRADGVEPRGLRAYVHGAGGVGQTIAISLAAEGVTQLAIYDIDPARAQVLAQRIQGEFNLTVTADEADLSGFELVVNASPLGLEPEDPLPFPVARLRPGTVVADVIMEPMYTQLLRDACARGLKIHHGRNMMNFAMPLAAQFYGLNTRLDWNGASVQNEPFASTGASPGH